MRYRPLGNTGLTVSEIGFGCGDNAGLIVRGTPAERVRAVERALELGINYFDTSPDYGKGLSETHLGVVFHELGVRPIVTTKVEIMPDQVDDMAGAVRRSVEASLKRLQLDWVDVVQIHNPPAAKRNPAAHGWMPISYDDMMGPVGALEGLDRLRREGKTRFLGFACEDAEAAAAARLLETGVFEVINVWFDLVNPTAGIARPAGLMVDYDYAGLIENAGRAGAGVGVIRPLAGGTLTDHAIAGGARHPLAGGGLTRNPEVYQEMVNQARPFAFLSRPGRSLQRAAVQFILMNPAVSTVLAGPSELAQLEEMVACSGSGPLSQEDLVRMDMVWRANFGRWSAGTWANV
jgi:L-glyceraldehyde 3-phosphate reductase